MMTATLRKILAALILTALSLQPAAACAVCYGAPGAPMTLGLNWAIFALGGVIGTVLFGVAAFFVHVSRRSAEMSKGEGQDEAPTLPE
jgi:hypothetical protein